MLVLGCVCWEYLVTADRACIAFPFPVRARRFGGMGGDGSAQNFRFVLSLTWEGQGQGQRSRVSGLNRPFDRPSVACFFHAAAAAAAAILQGFWISCGPEEWLCFIGRRSGARDRQLSLTLSLSLPLTSPPPPSLLLSSMD